ncbi:hypothetical protein AAG570_013847 [Ranatra chinensis]|uniref:Uncharacterized protein n=1 Tax=Ranatra chinensis TaxID=642074 RepID=A0ABD0YDC0_9HEMI
MHRMTMWKVDVQTAPKPHTATKDILQHISSMVAVCEQIDKLEEADHWQHSLAGDLMGALLTEHAPRQSLLGGFKGCVWEDRALISGLEWDSSIHKVKQRPQDTDLGVLMLLSGFIQRVIPVTNYRVAVGEIGLKD